jgi:hypothetical protein
MAAGPFYYECRRQDLNLHEKLIPPGPQPGASANSATPASEASITICHGAGKSRVVFVFPGPFFCQFWRIRTFEPIPELFQHGQGCRR